MNKTSQTVSYYVNVSISLIKLWKNGYLRNHLRPSPDTGGLDDFSKWNKIELWVTLVPAYEVSFDGVWLILLTQNIPH